VLKNSLAGSNQLYLTVLGRVLLTDTSSERVLVGYRRRPLALLSILAACGERGISRERLLLYLWPESDARHGRNTLSQTLYALKRGLRNEQVVTGTTVLSLNRAAIGCDLWDFERALAAGADEAAVGCYGGAFLNDFTIPGLLEFEQWVGMERTRLERSHRGALERLSMAAEKRGDPGQAVFWWRRLVDVAPLSTTAAMGLIRALASSGDRSAALDHARAYAALVRSELDSEPESAVLALIDQIRRSGLAIDRSGARASTHAPHPRRASDADSAWPTHPGPDDAPVEQSEELTAVAVEPVPGTALLPPWTLVETFTLPSASGLVIAEAYPGAADQRRELPRAVRVIGLLIAIAVVIAFMAAVVPDDMGIRSQQPGSASGTAAPTATVLPFAVTAPESLRGRAAEIQDLLRASLDRADVELVDRVAVRDSSEPESLGVRGPLAELVRPEAAPPGAASYVTGEIALTATRIRVTARWYGRHAAPQGADGGETLVTSAVGEGEPTQLSEVVEHVAAQLLAGRHTGPTGRLTRAAAEGTRELAAFQAYLRGERRLRRLEYVSAVEEFSLAVAADSGFALAHYRLSVAADRAGLSSLARAAAGRAAALDRSLAERDGALVRALAAAQLGDRATAERLYDAIVEDYPDDIEAWSRLGELAFRGNPLIGRSALDARPALEQVTRLDPDRAEALVLLARIAAADGRRDDADSLLGRVLAGRGEGVALAIDAVPSLAHWNPGVRWQAIGHPPRGAAFARPALTLDAALDPLDMWERARLLTRPELPSDVRAVGYQMRSRAGAARGEWAAASALLDSAQLLDEVPALELRAHLAAAPFLGVPRVARREIVARLSAWSPDAGGPTDGAHSPLHAGLDAHVRLHSLGLLHAALQEHARAGRIADSLELLPLPEGAPPAAGLVLAQSVRATSAFHAGRFGDVLRILGNTPWPAVADAFEPEVHDRFLRAEALLALGRLGEAARWYASIAQRAAYEQVYLAPSELRLGEIAERQGELARAARHYQRFVDLWADADSALQPQVAAARHRLAALSDPDPQPRRSLAR
jgi:DNA-binding SARP family transcriptional activator/tetratricopeptide (TPR) repeat protein